MAQNQGDVFASFLEAGDRHAVREATEEIVFDLVEGPVRRPEEAEIGAARVSRLAEADVFARVEHAKKVGLERRRELSDLVEKEGRPVGVADQAGPVAHTRVGEVLGVAEELRVDERIGERGRVAGEERPVRALRRGVNRVRDELFAGAARAGDEDVTRAAGDEGDRVAQLPGGGRFADDAVRVRSPERKGGSAADDRTGCSAG